MTGVCLYFQVHQPFRIRRDYSFFHIGHEHEYEEEELNRRILRDVARNCYLPANRVMLRLIKRHEGAFRLAFSITGTALEQFERYSPETLQSFQELVQTGCVELLGETDYHSLAFLFSPAEFKEQVALHQKHVESFFGVVPRTFRNTELIYNNALAEQVETMGFQAVITEGADRVLKERSPNFVYTPPGRKIRLLLKNYRLSDDLAFRFSSPTWEEYPLTARKYAGWLHQLADDADLINLFADYETFGEHQPRGSGIFEFLDALPQAVLANPDFRFVTPGEAAAGNTPIGELDIPDFISWADSERDISAWQGNAMQDAAAAYAYSLSTAVHTAGDPELLHTWRKLLTSDHFYYMCTKWDADGDVHTYFTPFTNAHHAYITYINILNDLVERLKQRGLSVPHPALTVD